MGGLLSPLDLIIFFASLIAVMGMGLWAGWREETASDYYLAGRDARWWGVAASIFGSNVSANHIVGMMGVGFAAGFVQSHFEISAIAGLLALCFGFLPMYRKLKVFTLSEYLSRRYDDANRMAYAIIMLVVIVVIQMVPGFYIGSRSLNLLLNDGRTAAAKATIENGAVASIEITDPGARYATRPEIRLGDIESQQAAQLRAVIEEEKLARIEIVAAGAGYADSEIVLAIDGGAAFDAQLRPGDVDPKWYQVGILLMAVVTGAYTIMGGLKAVIVTDVIQSILLLIAGLILAVITFSQPEVGGWSGMMALDSAPEGGQKMHLFKPMSDPQFPWTGVLSGLMVLHMYYWGANQFIVQRALAARSDREGRLGIIAAGFFKLLIPFFSIAGGVAAFYLFRERGLDVDQDVVFITLLTTLVKPIGFGLVGLVAAGMVGAILSSLDSMMNSAATITTFDVYQRYMRPDASQQELIWMGRVCIVIFILGSALLTVFTMDPNSKDSFFLQIATHQSKLVAGVVVAFLLGMLWRRATAMGALVAILVGVVVSYTAPMIYLNVFLPTLPGLADYFGESLNFMHSVFAAAVMATIAHVGISLATPHDAKRAEYTWDGQGVIRNSTLRRFFLCLAASLAIYIVLGVLINIEVASPSLCAIVAFLWTWSMFLIPVLRPGAEASSQGDHRRPSAAMLTDDRVWGGLLAACAIFMMFYFY